MDIDSFFMEKAYNLAKYVKGNVSPNPSVGAVIVKNGNLIGQGYTQKIGNNHAEVQAIRSVNEKYLLSGSTLYTTLEPCSYFGYTPPCTDMIIKYNINKVFIGSKDPNPKVNGLGIKKLKQHNISVYLGILKNKIDELNEDFYFFIKHQLPFGIAKYAMTIDGKINFPYSNKNIWISSRKSRLYSHKLRNQVDAILVGTNTILVDNPKLNVRLKKKWKDPIRIILDPFMKIPLSKKVLSDNLKSIWVIKESFWNENKDKNILILKNLKNKEILLDSTPSKKIDLYWLFKELGKKNILSILIEGGSLILSSTIQLNLIQKIFVLYP